MTLNLDLTTSLLICWLLAVHWWADFYCQTDEMSQAKHHSNYWLTVHVITYTGMLLLCTGMVLAPAFCLVNGGLHWVTDYFTSRWTARLYRAGKRHEFFTAIGVDQLIHGVTLVVTAYLLL